MEYLLHTAVLIGIYAIAVSALDVTSGYAGLISLAHAGFYGAGAYTTAVLESRFGWPFWATVPCAVAICAMLGVLVALPSLRVSKEYFILTTFAFMVITYSLLNNWTGLTGGPMGLPGLPRPIIAGRPLDATEPFLALVAASLAIWYATLRRMLRAPFGRALKAIRDDEVFAASLGKNVTALKIQAVVIGAIGAGLAGCLFATYFSFVDPSSFTVNESIFMLAIMIVGGAGSLKGPLLGAVLLVTLPEMLRLVGMPPAMAAALRQIAYGVLLVLVMAIRPRGILGRFAFGVGEL